MDSPKRRISKLESQVQGDEITTFEDLMSEIHRMLKADQFKSYVPRSLSPEVARVLEESLAELRQDPEFQHIFDDDAPERAS